MPSTPGTSHVNHLVQTWSPILHLAANDERVFTRYFMSGDDVEVTKVGNLFNMRKIAAVPGSTLGATTSPESLTETSNVEQNITVSPTFAYGFVSLGIPQLTRCLDWPGGAKYQKAYRTQIAAGIATKMDSDGATLAQSLSTNQVGGAGQHLSQDLILDAISALITTGKDQARINRVGSKTPKYLCYHPTEYKYVMKIAQITQSDIRGDAQRPTVSGAVWDGYGLELAESGNVSFDGALYHNMLHVSSSHVLGYNIGPEPMFLPVQEFHAAYRIIGVMEYAVGEVWDDRAVDIMTGS